MKRSTPRIVTPLFSSINLFLAMAILASIAMVSKAPFLFPSLGATALLFFTAPALPAASPRSAIVGHAIGILCGYAALLLTGLEHSPSTWTIGIDGHRIVAVALALAATGALTIAFKVGHPPAGATALIVSMGIISQPYQFGVMELAVIVLSLHAVAAYRLTRVHYPIWAPIVVPAPL